VQQERAELLTEPEAPVLRPPDGLDVPPSRSRVYDGPMPRALRSRESTVKMRNAQRVLGGLTRRSEQNSVHYYRWRGSFLSLKLALA
jgi:hypothetical protein